MKTSAKFIEPNRRVRYHSQEGRKMTGIVQDYLPLPGNENRAPILRRTRVVWIDRKELRKLPT